MVTARGDSGQGNQPQQPLRPLQRPPQIPAVAVDKRLTWWWRRSTQTQSGNTLFNSTMNLWHTRWALFVCFRFYCNLNELLFLICAQRFQRNSVKTQFWRNFTELFFYFARKKVEISGPLCEENFGGIPKHKFSKIEFRRNFYQRSNITSKFQ